MLANPGKMFIIAGIGLIMMGLLFMLSAKIPWLGKLPGDICIQRKNFSFYFPLASCIIISIILSLFFRIFSRR